MEETRQKNKTAIDEQDALTDELSAAIDGAKTLTELDDLYRSYKKNRKKRSWAVNGGNLQTGARLQTSYGACGRIYKTPKKGLKQQKKRLRELWI